MLKSELKLNLIFHFLRNPTVDYIITGINANSIEYKGLSGTHTFAAGCLISHFLEITEVTRIQHHPV
jgi:hypothetical protein